MEEKINRSVILKGAVGTYLGLGPKGIETELLMSQELGLGTPYIADWHGVRDVFAEYALTLALISKSFGRIGDELTLLQMTEIGETLENLGFKAIGSSTMPHKKNPRGPADIIGKDTAESMIHDIAMKAIAENISLSDAIKNDKIASQYFTDQDLKNLLDPETYIGLAIEQVKIIINQIESNKLD